MNGFTNKGHHNDTGMNQHIPKMQFPRFDGSNPWIWKEKFLDYLKLFCISEVMWVTSTTMNFDEPASQWLQVYKVQKGLGDWEDFVDAVEAKFGTYDYQRAMTELMQLKQSSSVQEYHQEFDQIRYKLEMQNTQLGEMFFVAQFVNGLKEEIRNTVYSQST